MNEYVEKLEAMVKTMEKYASGKNTYNITIPDYICDIIDECFSDDYYYL